MILVPVALSFGLLCLLKCDKRSQQIWTMLTTAGAVGVICLGAMSGDPMVLIFSLIGYMLLVIVGMAVSAAVKRRNSKSPAPLDTSAPASKTLYIVLGSLILAGLAGLAATGDRHALFGLGGLVIGMGVTLLLRAVSKAKR